MIEGPTFRHSQLRIKFTAPAGSRCATRPRTDSRPRSATIGASANNQRLDATVIVVGLPSATYAWTLVTPAGSGAAAFEPLLSSFTTITAAETGGIRGRCIRIRTVRAGDTIDSLSRRMAYPTLQRERFLTLNGLAATAPLTLGSLAKLVVTG